MPADELDLLSSNISRRLFELPELKEAKTISTYVHTGSEVRTMDIIEWCLEQKKRLIVPVTDKTNRKLVFSELKAPNKELEHRTFGILEPKPEYLRPVSLEEAQVILVPGTAWDQKGYRIGYGGGFYDRTINSLHGHLLKVGLSYEFQIVNTIPTTAYDRSVDKIVTENRTITMAHGR